MSVSDRMRPGVVSLPHGWGHGREGSKLSVAAKHAGANINDVIDDRRFDAVTGASALYGQPVTVTAV